MEDEEENNLVLGSCLSPNVHHLVCVVGSLTEITENVSVIDDNGLIVWESLHRILFSNYDRCWQDEVNFREHLARVAPLAHAAHVMLREENSFQNAGTLRLQRYFEWTSDQKTLTASLECLSGSNPSSGAVETCLLLTTAILERSLGNVFLTRNSCCPSMVKDLLVTEELVDIFGETALFCLRILMGPPTSLNLRNLLWHGFVKPGEIPPRYASFLLVIIASLGRTLEDQGIDPAEVRRSRPFIDVSSHGDLLQSKLPDISVEEMVLLAESLPIIPQGLGVLWSKALDYFKHGRCSESAVLILPVLESFLREVFAEANQCPERVLTAESSALFTTFDEILSFSLPDGTENKLRSKIGDTLLEMLLDLIVYPDGPRLRDRLSHGEFDFHAIPPSMVTFSVLIIAVLSMKVTSDSQLEKVGLCSKLKVLVKSYQSVFHPIAILSQDFIRVCDLVITWSALPQPTDSDGPCDGLEAVSMGKCEIAKRATDIACRMIESDIEDSTFVSAVTRFVDPVTETTQLATLCKGLRFQTLFRPRAELQLVTVLQQIVGQCAGVDHNVQTISQERFTQWETRNLRSRQRVNYQRFLQSISRLSCGVRVVIITVFNYLRRVNSWDLDASRKEVAQHYKFLKKVLKFIENLNSMTEKKKWDESCELIIKFFDLAEEFLTKRQELNAFLLTSEGSTKAGLSQH